MGRQPCKQESRKGVKSDSLGASRLDLGQRSFTKGKDCILQARWRGVFKS